MKNDIISIITPLYNSEKYIKQTIESVLAQTYKKWEIIVVDDVSTDKGIVIVKKYISKDNRIKLIQLEKNGGGAVARNKAIESANGRYIAFLDSDDLWHPKKLEKQIKFMQKKGYAFTFTKYQKMKENGELLDTYMDVPKRINYKKALFGNPIGCLTAVYDVEKLGKIYMPNIRKRQDYALWLKILKKEKYAYGLNESLAYYRLRENSVSSNKKDLIKYQWELYREIEKLNLFQSLFYLIYVVLQKILK